MEKNLFNKKLIRLEDNFYEVEGLKGGMYDQQAVKYDKLISNPLYNKIMWGNSPGNYTRFLTDSIANCDEGIIADIGCGTLNFTSEVYRKHNLKAIYLCDLSLEMLKIGRDRLLSDNNKTSNIQFIRADALSMPFNDTSVQTIFSFGFIHIMDKPHELINEFFRILVPRGKLYLTGLCTDRKFSSMYLRFLHKKGHVAKPMSSTEIELLIKDHGLEITNSTVIGGMCYLSAYKSQE